MNIIRRYFWRRLKAERKAMRARFDKNAEYGTTAHLNWKSHLLNLHVRRNMRAWMTGYKI